mgnify:CR=1 FL=1
MSKTIRVDEDTHADLARLKGEDESFDDVITRLLERRRDDIRDGAGYWSSADAERARETLQAMKDGVGGQWSS